MINYNELQKKMNDKNTINISITSDDGSYFMTLGKREKRSLSSVYLPKKQKQDINR